MARRHRGHGKKIDNLRWALGDAPSLAQSAGSVAQVFLAAGTNPVTLLRVHGEIYTAFDTAQSPGKLVKVTVGVIKVPEGSGTTVQYDPVSDDNAPWLLYQILMLGYEEMVTDVVSLCGSAFERRIIDNKAMRRIRPDEELQIVITNTTINGAASTDTLVSCRSLVGF